MEEGFKEPNQMLPWKANIIKLEIMIIPWLELKDKLAFLMTTKSFTDRNKQASASVTGYEKTNNEKDAVHAVSVFEFHAVMSISCLARF